MTLVDIDLLSSEHLSMLNHLVRLQLYTLCNSHASRFTLLLFLSWNEKFLSTPGLWAVLTEPNVVVTGKAKCADWPRAGSESHIWSYAVVQTDSLCTCANCTLVQTDWWYTCTDSPCICVNRLIVHSCKLLCLSRAQSPTPQNVGVRGCYKEQLFFSSKYILLRTLKSLRFYPTFTLMSSRPQFHGC